MLEKLNMTLSNCADNHIKIAISMDIQGNYIGIGSFYIFDLKCYDNMIYIETENCSSIEIHDIESVEYDEMENEYCIKNNVMNMNICIF